jgi:RNA polymerase sigma-70 factor (ECF subfamily)
VDQELFRLIGKAKSGDTDAFALLIKQYKDRVFRFAFGMLSDRMEAEDVMQEAFIKAYYSISRLESNYAFSSWMTRIVSNLCYDRIQKRKKENTVSSDQMEAGISTGGMERSDLHLTIEEAMKTLSPEHREAILLRDVEGYTYDEMAGLLHIPLGTVKSRINAARLLLRKEMKKEEDE